MRLSLFKVFLVSAVLSSTSSLYAEDKRYTQPGSFSGGSSGTSNIVAQRSTKDCNEAEKANKNAALNKVKKIRLAVSGGSPSAQYFKFASTLSK